MAKWNTPIQLPGDPTNPLEATTKQYVDAGLTTKAPVNNAPLTGVPTAPTAAAATDSDQLATTAFVKNQFRQNLTLAGDLLPDQDNVRSLGSPTLMWKDVYIGPGSLYLNGQKILEDTESGTIRMTADPNQNIAIQTQGTGDIELNPLGTGLIQLKSNIMIDGAAMIRSSDGLSILFDDSIEFLPGAGIVGGLTIDGNAAWHAGNFTPSSKLDASSYTAADVLTKIKTVDGAASGLDADLLDGLQGSSYLRADQPTGTFGAGTTNANVLLTFANPGVGYSNGFVFQRTSDGAGMLVTEYASDQTMYEFWMSDNPDTTTDIFSWRYTDWQGLNGLYQPLQISNKTIRMIGSKLQADSTIEQRTAPFFTTGDPTLASTDSRRNLNIINDATKLRTTGTGTVVISVLDVSGYTGTTGAVMWIKILDGTTFEWGYGSPVTNPVAVQTAVALSTSPVALSNGVNVTFNGSAGATAGDTFQCRVWRKPTTQLSDTTVVGTMTADRVVINSYNGGLRFANFSAGQFYAHGLNGSGDNVFSLNRLGTSSYDTTFYGRLYAGAGNEVWHSGTFNPANKLDATANAVSATKLQTARNFSLTGVVTALAVSFDGTGNVALATSIADGALSFAKTSGLQAALDSKVNTALLGAADGIATLGSDGKVLAAQLPAFVDDMLEYANLAAFPATGSLGKLYVALDTGAVYRWGGSTYVDISSGGTADAALRWLTARTLTLTGKVSGSVAFDGSSDFTLNVTGLSGVKSDVGLGNVDNTADIDKPVSTAQQTALNAKLDITTYTAADILTKLLTVDGAASGLDADRLDGQDGSFFQNASNLNNGTLAAARLPALSGDVTSTAGSAATTIAAGAVTLAKMANLPPNTFIGNNTAATTTPIALTVAQAKTLLALVKADVGLGNVDNTSDANKPVSTATQTALNDKVSIAATGLGKTGNYAFDSATDTAAEWSALPVGYSRMMSSTIGTAGGAPVANFGYFTKTANRDTAGGWAGIWVGYTAGQNYFGRAPDSTTLPTWEKIWTDANDGAASGLDSDLLDGQHGSYYLNATNINAGTLADGRLSTNIPLKNAANTFTAMQTVSVGNANVAGDYLTLMPVDYAVGKPRMLFKKESTLDAWTIGLWDGASSTGSIDFGVTTLTKQGNTIWHAGNFTPANKLDATANAVSASKLETARSIALTGDVTGSVSFDGTANVSIAAVADPKFAINRKFSPGISGGTRRWMRLATCNGINASAGAHLTLFLSGTGDFGDADRGTSLVHFAQRGVGGISVRAWNFGVSDTLDPIEFHTQQVSDFEFELWAKLSDYNFDLNALLLGAHNSTLTLDMAGTTPPANPIIATNVVEMSSLANKLDVTAYTASDVLAKLLGVDGAGSSLDADLLDGQQGSWYADLTNATGTLNAARLPAFTGDVTSPAGSSVNTIAAKAVTLAKMADLPASTFIGNNAGTAGVPMALTAAQAKTLLALTKVDVGLSNVDNTSDANKPVSTAQQTALNAKLNSTSKAVGVTVTDTRNDVTTPDTFTSPGMTMDFKLNATEGLSDGGTYFAEMTIRPYGSLTDWSGGPAHQMGYTTNGNVWHRHGTSTTWGAWKKFWDSGNDGAGSGLDADLLDGQEGAFYQNAGNLNAGTVPAARMPAFTGDITTTAGAVATTIANGAVTLAKMANLPANSFIGNNTGVAAAPIALTVAQTKTLLALTKTDVGLGNVDNTSDANKPISTATQTALDGKISLALKGAANGVAELGPDGKVLATQLPAQSGITWNVVTNANVAAAATNNGYLMQTGGTLRTVTLPASVGPGFYVVVNANGGSVRIVANGNTIEPIGAGNDLIIEDGNTITLVGIGTGVLDFLYGGTGVSVTAGASGMAWYTITNADVNMTANAGYIMKTGGTTRNATLPAGVQQGEAFVVSAKEGFARVVTNGNTIQGVPPGNDLLLSENDTVYLVASANGVLEIMLGATLGQDGADGANGQGVPAGGTVGQVLVKASGADYDTVWINGKITQKLSTAFVSATTTFMDALSFNVAAGKRYRFEFIGTFQTAATTTGCKVGMAALTGATGTINGVFKAGISANAVATELAAPLYSLSGAGSSLTTTDVSGANVPHHLSIVGVFDCTVGGSLALQFATEVATSNAQLNAGSMLIVEELP